MSLVNDLLIEADRRRDERDARGAPRRDRHSIFDHAPSGFTPRKPAKKRILGVPPVALVSLGAMFVVLAAIPAFMRLRDTLDLSFDETPTEQRPPSVSARPVEPAPFDVSAVANSGLGSQAAHAAPATSKASDRSASNDQIYLRPIAVRSVTISNDEDTTRLRIAADESAAYRIVASEDNLAFDIVLAASALQSPIADLDMIGTPIRSIRAHADDPNLRLSIALDRVVRIQSQWTWQDYGAVLVIDLQDSTRSASAEARPDTRGGTREFDRPARRATRRETAIATEQTTSFEPTHSFESEVDGDRLHISRSVGDQQRFNRQQIRDRARENLESARLARTQGRTTEADALYRSAIETLPGYRDAILEWAALLADTDRTAEAVSLVREARHRAPSDAGLTMLHATLLAEVGDFDTAVAILDRADHSLTQAPDVHALAAAFLQQDGKHERAIERYEKVLRRYPGESRWWMGLGISFEALDKTAEALDVYRIAMQLGELPGNTQRWVSMRVAALSEKG